MKNKKIVGIIVAIICMVAVIGLIVFAIIKSNNPEQKLKEETQKVGMLDLTRDEVDMNITTKDDYGVVEKTIKEYINDYSNSLKEIQDVLNDEKLQRILTVNNYKNDSPEFSESLSYISTSREKYNNIMKKLISLTNEETMMNAIEGKNLSDEYINLYKELMVGNGISSELTDAEITLEVTNDRINRMYEIQEEIISMLKNNPGSWFINDENAIQFNDENLLNKYNEYIDELARKNTNETENGEAESPEQIKMKNADNDDNNDNNDNQDAE